MLAIAYPFTEQDSQRAYDEWGANCGPNALAFALQVPLDTVRPLIPDFESKRYTSPTMMKAALDNAGVKFTAYGFPRIVAAMFSPQCVSLVRVQWTGPWTQPGVNPKWAYRQTHWIAAWDSLGHKLVFDVNGGVMGIDEWKETIVPLILKSYPRADGGWHPTHVWRIER